jgi:hypothetical protein
MFKELINSNIMLFNIFKTINNNHISKTIMNETKFDIRPSIVKIFKRICEYDKQKPWQTSIVGGSSGSG